MMARIPSKEIFEVYYIGLTVTTALLTNQRQILFTLIILIKLLKKLILLLTAFFCTNTSHNAKYLGLYFDYTLYYSLHVEPNALGQCADPCTLSVTLLC